MYGNNLFGTSEGEMTGTTDDCNRPHEAGSCTTRAQHDTTLTAAHSHKTVRKIASRFCGRDTWVFRIVHMPIQLDYVVVV